MPIAELAALLRDELTDEIAASYASIDEFDWGEATLDLADADDRKLAAHATALGAALFYSFGNFCAIAAHPDRRSVVRVNLVKGRPENQVGSVTTTRDRVTEALRLEAAPGRHLTGAGARRRWPGALAGAVATARRKRAGARHDRSASKDAVLAVAFAVDRAPR